jgi:ElaB/YqjD/DUF883 family membrane-anchored ribosome-binding protein
MSSSNTVKLNGTMDSLLTKGAGIANDAAAWVESEVDSAARIGSQTLGKVRALTKESLDEAGTMLTAAMRRTSHFVRKYPTTSVAVVLLVGYAASRAMRSRGNHVSARH